VATVEDAASLVLAAIDTSADRPIGIQQAAGWVSNRYAELVSKTRFRQLRKMGTITIPVSIAAGTVTPTLNSATIVADATAQASLTGAIVGRYIRIHTVWYEITTYAAPNITIANAYSELDGTGLGYVILPRFHTLAADARWLGKFVFPRRRRSLGMRSLHDLDRVMPERLLTGDGPWYVAEATNAASGRKRVELYPYSRTEETIYYTYWGVPPTLALDDILPQEIDIYVLREGALIDAFRYRASQEANAGRIDAAGYWRNEQRAQATSWQTQIMDAAKADRGQDDVSFIYNVLGLPMGESRDIVTARDFIYVQGSRP